MKKIYWFLAILPILASNGCACSRHTKPVNPPTPPDPPVVTKSITFSRESISLFLNDTYQVNCSLSGFTDEEKETLTWVSSDTHVATVNSTGFITANNVGPATVSASIGEYSASLAVTVMSDDEIPYFTCIENLETYKNEVLSFNENTKFKGVDVEATYSYVSNDSSVVLVEGTTVTAVGKGKADVTITSSYKGYLSSLICHVNVIDKVEVVVNKENILLAPSSYSGTAFIKEEQLDAHAYVDNNEISTSFSWNTSNSNIATVENGLVRSVNIGQTIITCSIEYNDETYSKKVLVEVATPKNYIEETLIVNINGENKILDLAPVGLDNSQVISIEETYHGVTKSLLFAYENGVLYLQGIDESYAFTTRTLDIRIGEEIYTCNVTFKEYVKDKLYFADSASHLDCIAGRNSNIISYDAEHSLPESAIAASDKELFANEGVGSSKIQMTGINEEAVVLLNPEFQDVSSYSYIVFYVYTEYSGYNGGAWWTGDATLTPGQWTRVVISDFDSVMDTNGVYIKDKGYDITNFVVRFNNYKNPSKDAVMWLSSIYACSPQQDYIVSEVSRTVSDYTKVFAIEVLRPIQGFDIDLDLGESNTLYYGAITVENGDHWVEVLANNFDIWYRKEGTSENWWTKMGVWKEFFDTSSSEGTINIRTNWYAPEPGIADSGLITSGTTVYVAVKTAPTVDYEFVKCDKTYNDYDVYAAKVLRQNNGFVFEIETEQENKGFIGAITVDHGEKWVEVKTTDFDKWYRKEGTSENWWTKMGNWETFSGTTDNEGKITLTTGIYATSDVPDYGPMSIGTIIYVAIKISESPEPTSDYSISSPADKTYEDYKVYAVTILRENSGFTAEIDFGIADQAFVGAITVDHGDRWVEVLANNFDIWYRKEGSSEDWWTKMGVWKEFSGYTDSNGKVSITTGIYATSDVPDYGPMTVGTVIYVALKEYDDSGDIYSVALATDKTYEDYTVYAVTVLQENTGFVAEIDVGNANASLVGAITVDHGEKWVEVTAGNGFDKWYRKTWNYSDWWTKMGEWEYFSDTSDENGKISITTGIYASSDVPDYGPMSIGTTIYVAVKDSSSVEIFSVYRDYQKQIENYDTVYCIELLMDTNSIEIPVQIGAPNQSISGKYTIECSYSVWFQPQIGDSVDKYFNTGEGWWEKFGNLVSFTATTNDEGKIIVQLNDYLGTPLPAGAKMYIAFNS